MWKNIKAILISFVLFTSLAVMAVVFGYGFDYFKAEYQNRVEEAKLKKDLEGSVGMADELDPSLMPALLLGEVKDGQSESSRWDNLYTLSEDGDKYFLVEPRQEIAAIADPVASGQQLFYYAWSRDSGKEIVILRSFDLASGRDEMIISADKENSLRGAWLAPSGEKLIYQKFNPSTEETAYWSYSINNRIFEEMIIPDAGLYPTPYQAWGADSERFYLTKNVGSDSYVLFEARGSAVTPAFPAFRWNKIDWSDMWQVKPMAVSPDGMTALYIDRQKVDGVVEKTDINIIDQSGGITNLVTMSGDVYELAWSPDSKQLTFNFAAHDDQGDRDRVELWVMDGDGSNPTKVYAAGKGAMLHDLHWSRDSKDIYFVERQPQLYSLVQALDTSSGQVETLERHLVQEGEDSYLRILERLDMPKSLDWQEK